MNRIILRFSLNNDTRSAVRNDVADFLQIGGFSNTKTGTWEAAGTPAAMAAVGTALNMLANPAQISGADPAVATDHIWFYVD